MPDRNQFELMLLQYAPDAITNEFATIGVLLLESDGAPSPSRASVAQPPSAVADGAPAHSRALIRFTRDWRRVRCLDPTADVEMLAALEDDLRAQLLRGPLDRATVLAKLQDYCSNGIRLTEPKACLAEDPQREIELLARLYLERPLWRGSPARVSARQAIVARMKDAFEQAGVWGHMLKKIAAAPYTFAGDPLKLDCGYTVDGRRRTADGPDRADVAAPPSAVLAEHASQSGAVSGRPSAVSSPAVPSRASATESERAAEDEGARVEGPCVRFFHAVSLASDPDSAKILAFSFPQLRQGIAEQERRRAELTAITEDALDLGDPGVAFALATLQRSDIVVTAVRDVPRLAERARADLGV